MKRQTDLSDLVDFHAHIIPGADHGSRSVETSLSQLRFAIRSGVRKVIATPHFYAHRDTVDDFLSRRAAGYDALSRAMAEVEELPKVRLGAEVLLCTGLERMEGLSKLCVEGTNVLLLEMPFHTFSPEFVDAAETMIRGGLCVVLAHVDRYPPENVRKMLDVGCHAQINAQSLCRLLGRRGLLGFVKDGTAVALGSDIHGTDADAYRYFAKAKGMLGDGFSRISAFSASVFDGKTPDLS